MKIKTHVKKKPDGTGSISTIEIPDELIIAIITAMTSKLGSSNKDTMANAVKILNMAKGYKL